MQFDPAKHPRQGAGAANGGWFARRQHSAPEPWQLDLPPHDAETLPWRQEVRRGTREDRMLSTVTASIPPDIAGLAYQPPGWLAALSDDALQEIARTDTECEGEGQALARFMIRTESIASSRIEHEEATSEEFARAIAGQKANTSATSMVAATEAMQQLLHRTADTGQITMDAVADAHRALMHRDESATDAHWAGRVRNMQNWIGGSDASPRGALYVPPAPGRVHGLLSDLQGYLDRDDVPVLTQAAIGHAQFESIHPFTDGNGRIGRALLGAVLQRRQITRNAVVPVASGLRAVREEYFAALGEYRAGRPEPIIELVARTSRVAAIESRTSIRRLRALPDEWATAPEIQRRRDSHRVSTWLAERPTVTGEDATAYTGSASSGYAVIDAFERAGILREVTGRKRDRLWVVVDVLGELDDLDRRIEQRIDEER